jgi:DNA-binding transcriptional ArsR family regulator
MRGIKLGEPSSTKEGSRMRVELDKVALFALASDTRIEILKNMQQNRMTVTQLADKVEVDKAAVHRHLKKLEEGGFVKREEDHGFVYYSLTWRARDILSPNENTKIVVLISSSILLLGVISLILIAITATPGPAPSEYTTGNWMQVGDTPSAGDKMVLQTAPEASSSAILIVLGLATVVIIVTAIAAYVRMRPPKLPPDEKEPESWPEPEPGHKDD